MGSFLKFNALWLVGLIACWVPANAVLGNSFGHDDSVWMDNVEQAIEKGRIEGKDLLLLFTGSDWCAPCQKLEQNIAE